MLMFVWHGCYSSCFLLVGCAAREWRLAHGSISFMFLAPWGAWASLPTVCFYEASSQMGRQHQCGMYRGRKQDAAALGASFFPLQSIYHILKTAHPTSEAASPRCDGLPDLSWFLHLSLAGSLGAAAGMLACKCPHRRAQCSAGMHACLCTLAHPRTHTMHACHATAPPMPAQTPTRTLLNWGWVLPVHSMQDC